MSQKKEHQNINGWFIRRLQKIMESQNKDKEKKH